MKELPLKTSAFLTTLALSLTTFAEDTATNPLSTAVGQVGSDIQSATQSAISTGAKIAVFLLFIAFFLFILGGGVGGYFYYTRTRGNPQQPADTRMAIIYGVMGVVLGIVLWMVLYYIFKLIGIDAIAIIKSSIGGGK